MRLQKIEASDCTAKFTQKAFEICSLVDHIQDEDHSEVLRIIDLVSRDYSLLDPPNALALMGLVERIREHIRFERKELFPTIREWAQQGTLTDIKDLRVRCAMHSKFVYGWNHILEEFQELQENISLERMQKNLERLGEELFWYVQAENRFLFPVLSKQLA